MGVLDHFTECLDISSLKARKRRPRRTVKIRVKMDCEGCERKVRNAVSSMEDVESVEVNRKQSLVMVTGCVEAEEVLREVKKTGKTRAQMWPYVNHNLVAYPYVAQAYDKKAPIGFVRSVPQAQIDPNAPGEQFAAFFNENDPNASCSIM